MTPGQFLSILRARWWLVLLVLATAVLVTVVANLLMPRQYTATATVVVDFKPDPLTAMIYGGMASPGFMATQVDIIRSERVAQQVVRNLKLAENPQVRAQWQDETGGQGSIESWLGGVFQKQMDVVPSRESSVIAISYKAPDARFAAGLANAFMQAYIDTALALRVDPARQYSSFFETRSREAREALQAAQSALSSFQKDNGIIATEERLDVETARLNELSSQLTVLQAVSAESTRRQAQAQGAQGDRLAEVLNNSNVSQLKADIHRTETRLQELSTRLGDQHPAVLETRASLGEQRKRLDLETQKVAGGVTVNNTINRQREADVRAALEAQRAKVLKMKSVRDRGLVLLQDVGNAQRAYDALQQRHTQTSLEGQTTQSNLNVLSQATPPLEASSPRMLINTIYAAFGGMLGGLLLALLWELLDRRLRNLDDVAATLGLPVLGVLPAPHGARWRGRGRVPLMQQRILAPLSQPGRGA